MGTFRVGFDITDLLLIRFSTFVRYWRRKRKFNERLHELFICFKKAYVSIRREVLYSILIERDVPTKLVRLIEIKGRTWAECVCEQGAVAGGWRKLNNESFITCTFLLSIIRIIKSKWMRCV
jgi:hypothetical protein